MSRPLTKHNLGVQRKALERRKEIRRLLARGMSYAEIGRQLNLTRQRIYQIAHGGGS